MAIEVQLAAADALGGGGHSATSSSRNVALGPGASRLLLVASALEAASGGASQVTGVTYAGAELEKVTDGELTADLNTLAGSDDVAHLAWWVLREDDLPADGTHALVANVSAGRQHGLAWFILEGADQGPSVRDVAMGFNSSAQSISATVDADPDGLVLCVAYKNNTGVASPANTIDGAAATALSDDQNQGGAHVRFFRGVGDGSCACVFSHSSGNARIGIVAVSLSPAADAPETLKVSGSATAPMATASGSATVAVEVSGAAVAPLATASGSAAALVSVSGAATAPLALASGAAAVSVAVSGSPSAPLAMAQGSTAAAVGASGAASAPMAVAAGSVSVGELDVPGFLRVSPVADQVKVTRPRADSVSVVPVADNVRAWSAALRLPAGTTRSLPIACRSGATGALSDPDALEVSLSPASGEPRVYTWPGDAELARVGVGRFALGFDAPAQGQRVSWSVAASGAVAAVTKGALVVY